MSSFSPYDDIKMNVPYYIKNNLNTCLHNAENKTKTIYF